MTRGRWGPPAGRGRRGCYYCRRDMRPADSPASRPLRAGRGKVACALDQVEDALLDAVRQLGRRSWRRRRGAHRGRSLSSPPSSRARGDAGAVRARRGRGLCGPRARAGCGRCCRGARSGAAGPEPWTWTRSSRSCRSRSRPRGRGRSGRRRRGSGPRARRSRRIRRRSCAWRSPSGGRPTRSGGSRGCGPPSPGWPWPVCSGCAHGRSSRCGWRQRLWRPVCAALALRGEVVLAVAIWSGSPVLFCPRRGPGTFVRPMGSSVSLAPNTCL